MVESGWLRVGSLGLVWGRSKFRAFPLQSHEVTAAGKARAAAKSQKTQRRNTNSMRQNIFSWQLLSNALGHDKPKSPRLLRHILVKVTSSLAGGSEGPAVQYQDRRLPPRILPTSGLRTLPQTNMEGSQPP